MGEVTSGSIIDGYNPLTDAIGLLLLQVAIIISFARSLGYLLKFINQPAVIAEVSMNVV
jgi:Kef-type K+ transport system membrane component KefB